MKKLRVSKPSRLKSSALVRAIAASKKKGKDQCKNKFTMLPPDLLPGP